MEQTVRPPTMNIAGPQTMTIKCGALATTRELVSLSFTVQTIGGKCSIEVNADEKTLQKFNLSDEHPEEHFHTIDLGTKGNKMKATWRLLNPNFQLLGSPGDEDRPVMLSTGDIEASYVEKHPLHVTIKDVTHSFVVKLERVMLGHVTIH